MKDGDRVKVVKGEFTGREGEIFATCMLAEIFQLSNPRGSTPKKPASSVDHFLVKEKGGSIFPAFESELELIT
ncbi:MAG: hypothetical protein ABSD79_00990 [Dehalococcoidales bacterium]|jgi:hypothetical protein